MKSKIEIADEMAMGFTKPNIAVLTKYLNDKDDRVITAAADAIGHIGPFAAETWPRLVELLKDTTKPYWLRDTCAYALGGIEMANRQVYQALTAASKEDSNVGRIAKKALGIFPPGYSILR